MPHKKLLVVQLCAARYPQLLSFVNQSANWHYAVWTCVFMCVFVMDGYWCFVIIPTC